MKTSKSPEVTDVTPSKKKLKQARLPFKIISEVSPKPATPLTRKRKLSSPDVELVTKIGKISKENDTVQTPLIVIDDDSKDEKFPETNEKMPNPYVKLVDTAWKKKLQKAKGFKKKKTHSKGTKDEIKANGSVEPVQDKTAEESEMMEVDEPANDDTIRTINPKSAGSRHVIQKETENSVHGSQELSDIVVLEDINNFSGANQTATKNDEFSDKSESEEASSITKLTNISDTESVNQKDTNLNHSKVEDSSKESPQSSDTENDQKGSETEELKIPITPKRSARSKAKMEENNNSKGSPSNSSHNESMTSNPSTPKNSRSSSITKLDRSLNESATSNNLTPKQLQKKLESVKKREEREKEKQDRDKKRQQEKDERARQRQEKEDQKKREREEKEESKRKEKEEKEEQKRKEKEEKEKMKELEKKQRDEKDEQKRKEKEEKEEQKRKEREAREEEKRKKQEAVELEKQEQELKKKKTAEAFVSFFVPKQKAEKDQPIVGTVSNNMLTNFTLKSDMRLAPTIRTTLTEEKAQELVRMIKEQSVDEEGLYLKRLKNGASKPLSSGKTWPHSDNDDDVILIEDELPPMDGAGEILTCEPAIREELRPKLLSFHENRRPPYWGTWRKKSSFIKPRRPFGQDEKQLDYEVDSDDDWEEEQEGESIDGSAAGSDDEQGPDEYEVDNEVFVPHGYLSDEEATMDEDDVLSLSPETQKAKLKYLEDEFESEMKKPTEKLKPRLYGILWENSEGGKPDKCVDAMWNYFGKLAMIMNDPTALLQPSQEPDETEKKKVKKKKPAPTTDGEQSPKADKKKKAKSHEKEGKPPVQETKKNVQDVKKNQPGINMFLTKIKST